MLLDRSKAYSSCSFYISKIIRKSLSLKWKDVNAGRKLIIFTGLILTKIMGWKTRERSQLSQMTVDTRLSIAW